MNWILNLLTLALCASAVAQKIDDALFKKLNLSGITFNTKEQYIDVNGSVCLDSGALELVACTKDTKEHEAILLMEAKAIHIHTALLLLGASSGSPAMQKQVGEGEEMRWVFYPASGQPIEVSLVYTGEDGKESVRPIADFIQKIQEEDALIEGQESENEKAERFPTSTFLFMGSHLIENGKDQMRYIAEESGNVITISGFGDEMLGLPERYSNSNDSLVWEVDSEKIPPVGTKIRLRLKPVFAAPAK